MAKENKFLINLKNNGVSGKFYFYGSLVIFALLILLLYFSATKGPLLLDDYPNILYNPNLKIESLTYTELKSAANSMHRSDESLLFFNRPISFISFALNFYFFDDPFQSIKLVNVFLHSLCGILIGLLMRQLICTMTRIQPNVHRELSDKLFCWLPPIVAGFWLFHPLMVSTVLYSVQRMTILSTFFTLAGLNLFISYREKLRDSGQGMMLATTLVGLLSALAILSKENGALIFLFIGFLEVGIFRWQFHAAVNQRQRTFYLSLLVLPALMILGYLAYYYFEYSAQVLPFREFTIDQRLMTEARILFDYLYWLILPTDFNLQFHHDLYPLSIGLLNPVTTLVSVVGWLLVIVLLLISWMKQWFVLFLMIGWYLLGHLIESTVLSLELVFEHRNYLPYIGPMFGLVWLAITGLNRLNLSNAFQLFILIVLFIAIPASLTASRIKHWQSKHQLVEHWLKTNPNSARVWASQADLLLSKKQYPQSMQALNNAMKLAPFEAGYGFAQLAILCENSAIDSSDYQQRLISLTLKALATPPATAYTQSQLGSFNMRCRDVKQVRQLQALYQTLAANSANWVAAKGLYILAMIALDDKNLTEADRLLALVLEKDPKASQVRKLRQELQARLNHPKG